MGAVWAVAGQIGLTGPTHREGKSFQNLGLQLPINTKDERKLTKITRSFRKIWEFFWR
jgi:hypothetical protein